MRQKTPWKKLQLPTISDFRAFLCAKVVAAVNIFSLFPLATVAPSLIAKCHFHGTATELKQKTLIPT